MRKENDFTFCNNCGKEGHGITQCKTPITSLGVVAFRWSKNATTPEYLMICRKDTLGFIDFMRGKYSVSNHYYIMNMFKQMTLEEKEKILNRSFEQLWSELWGFNDKKKKVQYNTEERISRDKFMKLKNSGALEQMLNESFQRHPLWTEPEWGFPKGRRDHGEKDFDCAIREFTEETGYATQILTPLQNLFPFEENFMGSNYKSYKHKYFLAFIDYDDSISFRQSFQQEEVLKMEWKTLDECLECIRDYNTEKKKIIRYIDSCISHYNICKIF